MGTLTTSSAVRLVCNNFSSIRDMDWDIAMDRVVKIADGDRLSTEYLMGLLGESMANQIYRNLMRDENPPNLRYDKRFRKERKHNGYLVRMNRWGNAVISEEKKNGNGKGNNKKRVIHRDKEKRCFEDIYDIDIPAEINGLRTCIEVKSGGYPITEDYLESITEILTGVYPTKFGLLLVLPSGHKTYEDEPLVLRKFVESGGNVAFFPDDFEEDVQNILDEYGTNGVADLSSFEGGRQVT